MLKAFFLFFAPLLTDDTTGRVSASKLWMHIGLGAITYKYLNALDPGVEMLGAFAVIVCGNHGALYWIKKKYGNSGAESSPEMAAK